MPWERVSAAIGYALYDEKLDTVAKDVLTRADQEMYKCKKEMKQMR
jgi:GGDEF domain-containing protein